MSGCDLKNRRKAHHDANNCSLSFHFRVQNKTRGSWIFHWKERIQCFFEGGKNCKHCGMKAWIRNRTINGNNALDGLNSNWITNDLLAMARPVFSQMEKHSLIDQMYKRGIRSIINLEEPGEHAHCGCGLLMSSGFSYSPEDFMKCGIHYYNLNWRDMSAPTIEVALKIIQV